MQPLQGALTPCTACNNRHITTDGVRWRCDYHLVLFPTAGRHSRAPAFCTLASRCTTSHHTRDSGLPPHHMACFLPPSLSLSVATRPTPACRPVTEPVFAPPWGGCLADPPGGSLSLWGRGPSRRRPCACTVLRATSTSPGWPGRYIFQAGEAVTSPDWPGRYILRATRLTWQTREEEKPTTEGMRARLAPRAGR
jgi:hypothetical protein